MLQDFLFTKKCCDVIKNHKLEQIVARIIKVSPVLIYLLKILLEKTWSISSFNIPVQDFVRENVEYLQFQYTCSRFC